MTNSEGNTTSQTHGHPPDESDSGEGGCHKISMSTISPTSRGSPGFAADFGELAT